MLEFIAALNRLRAYPGMSKNKVMSYLRVFPTFKDFTSADESWIASLLSSQRHGVCHTYWDKDINAMEAALFSMVRVIPVETMQEFCKTPKAYETVTAPFNQQILGHFLAQHLAQRVMLQLKGKALRDCWITGYVKPAALLTGGKATLRLEVGWFPYQDVMVIDVDPQLATVPTNVLEFYNACQIDYNKIIQIGDCLKAQYQRISS